MYSGKSISAPFSNLSSHKSTTEQQLLLLLPLLLKYYVWLFGKLAQFSRITPRMRTCETCGSGIHTLIHFNQKNKSCLKKPEVAQITFATFFPSVVKKCDQ